jgi:hypothetical protein
MHCCHVKLAVVVTGMECDSKGIALLEDSNGVFRSKAEVLLYEASDGLGNENFAYGDIVGERVEGLEEYFGVGEHEPNSDVEQLITAFAVTKMPQNWITRYKNMGTYYPAPCSEDLLLAYCALREDR